MMCSCGAELVGRQKTVVVDKEKTVIHYQECPKCGRNTYRDVLDRNRDKDANEPGIYRRRDALTQQQLDLDLAKDAYTTTGKHFIPPGYHGARPPWDFPEWSDSLTD